MKNEKVFYLIIIMKVRSIVSSFLPIEEGGEKKREAFIPCPLQNLSIHDTIKIKRVIKYEEGFFLCLEYY